MLTRLVRASTTAVASHWRLVLGLWAFHLLLAASLVMPFGMWLTGALSTATETQKLASGFDVAVVADVIEMHGAGEWLLGMLSAMALISFGAIASAFIAGGVISRVGWSGRAERFGTAGARFFWPNLRMLVMTAVVGGVVVGLVYAALRGATSPFVDSISEAASWTRALVPPVGAALALLFVWLVLDFARIGLVATDDRRGRRHLVQAARFVSRQIWSVAGWWLLVACAVVAGALAYIFACRAVEGPAWAAIATTFVLQQLLLMWRAATHVGRVAGQIEQAHALGFIAATPAVSARVVIPEARVVIPEEPRSESALAGAATEPPRASSGDADQVTTEQPEAPVEHVR